MGPPAPGPFPASHSPPRTLLRGWGRKAPQESPALESGGQDTGPLWLLHLYPASPEISWDSGFHRFIAGPSPGLTLPPKLGDRYSADQVVWAGPVPEEAAGGDRPETGGEGAAGSSPGVDPAAAGPSSQGGCGSPEGLGAPAPPAGQTGQCEGHSLSPDSGARAGLGHVQRPGAGAEHLERDPGVPAAPWVPPGQNVSSAAAVDDGGHPGRRGVFRKRESARILGAELTPGPQRPTGGGPPGGTEALPALAQVLDLQGSPRLLAPRVAAPPSPQPGTKAPQARPRMSAQEQLERIRRNQECGRPLPRPPSPRLLTLGRTLSPARCQPDVEQRPVLGGRTVQPVRCEVKRASGGSVLALSQSGLGHAGAPKWLRSSGSWSSSRNTTPYIPMSEGHRERVLSLSQALATEASQWHRMMTGGNLDSGGETLPPVPPPPSNPKPPLASPPRSPPVANSRSPGFSRRGSGRGAGPASWAPTWDSGAAPPALIQDEGAWPLRVTLLQSSF